MESVIKVATWNVNSLRVRLGQVEEFLATEAPDILCLQETKVEDAHFPAEALARRGYHAVCHGQKGYNGVAILSRLRAQEVATGMGGEDLGGQARLLAATVGGLRVVSAYVPNGEGVGSPKFAYKEEFYRRLAAYAEEEAARHPRLVLAGDFNVAADERDVANPARAVREVLFTPAEQGWLRALKERAALTDSFRHVSQQPHVYSWWDYRTFARNPGGGMRIDYLLAGAALVPRIAGVTHHAAYRSLPQPSDHIPITLELRPAP